MRPLFAAFGNILKIDMPRVRTSCRDMLQGVVDGIVWYRIVSCRHVVLHGFISSRAVSSRGVSCGVSHRVSVIDGCSTGHVMGASCHRDQHQTPV